MADLCDFARRLCVLGWLLLGSWVQVGDVEGTKAFHTLERPSQIGVICRSFGSAQRYYYSSGIQHRGILARKGELITLSPKSTTDISGDVLPSTVFPFSMSPV